MCLQGGGPRGLCVTSWRCQTPGIAVKHALAHVAICSVTRQHLGVPQTTEDEHGRQRRTVDPEAGTRAIDRPRSLLAGVWARRGVHLAYHVLQTAWRVFRQSCQEFGCRADARGGYATLVTTRDSSTPTRIITTQSRELATAPASDPLRATRWAGATAVLAQWHGAPGCGTSQRIRIHCPPPRTDDPLSPSRARRPPDSGAGT